MGYCRFYPNNILPEFLKYAPTTKGKYRPVRFLSPRGGVTIEVTEISGKIVTQVMVNFLAKKGLQVGLAAGRVLVISKIPSTVVIRFLRDAFPQNLPDLERKKFIVVDEETIYLDECNQNLKYLFDILKDQTIPFEERKEIAHSMLAKYLNLKTPVGRRNFILCIVFIIYYASFKLLSYDAKFN